MTEQSKDSDKQQVKIAVLSSYTVRNIDAPLRQSLRQGGFEPVLRFGEYDQYSQELLDPSSWLSDFKPDFILLCLSTSTVLHDIEHLLLEHQNAQELLDSKAAAICAALTTTTNPGKILVTLLEHPGHSPFGFSDATHPHGMRAMLDRFNQRLIEAARSCPNIHLLDFDSIVSSVGRPRMTDEKMYYLGKVVLSKDAASSFASEIASFIIAALGNMKKCIIVDLDNTLWGGLAGEDGPHALALGTDGVGSIFLEIQKTLLTLKKRGILLAFVSKNNVDDVRAVFNKNTNMILKWDDFVAYRANWTHKSTNIEEIARELNIGLDSIVFIDDNPAERLEVSTNLPSVTVMDFPADVARLPILLKQSHHFKSISITKEDVVRHEMYLQDKNRSELKQQLSLDDYLKNLKMRMTIKINDIPSLDRITQLINKTNQFNLRTRRYTSEQVRSMMTDGRHLVISASVSDMFGDQGLTGLLIIEKRSATDHFIDTFLLSCRILSRNIEFKFFQEALRMVDAGTTIHAEYVSTPKNKQVADLYDRLGFVLLGHEGDNKSYSLHIDRHVSSNIDYIEVLQ